MQSLTHCIAKIVAHESLPVDLWKSLAIVLGFQIWHESGFLWFFEGDGFKLKICCGGIETADQASGDLDLRSG